MRWIQGRLHASLGSTLRKRLRPALVARVVPLVVAGVVPAAEAQRQTVAARPLVFDQVTVVDVERGRLLPGQRVVVVGTRIQAVGKVGAVKRPAGAQVVDARGKYLIPGLWDMHVHLPAPAVDHKALIVAGVTGIRDAASLDPLDTLLRWRREILAGTRVGPPRQILSGVSISGGARYGQGCRKRGTFQVCVTDSADARHLVDSLKAAGADMIKPRILTKDLYFAIAAAARRLGIPFGGHVDAPMSIGEASDSGATLIDHPPYPDEIGPGKAYPTKEAFLAQDHSCLARMPSSTVAQCRPVAERFRRNNTWWVPTMAIHVVGHHFDNEVFVAPRYGAAVRTYARQQAEMMGYADSGSAMASFVLQGRAQRTAPEDAPGLLSIAHEVGLPLLAGTDREGSFYLHLELAVLVAEGLTPLEALQAATLNPARMLRGTDSLGTVAAGKLADLVLLDADPLVDIANTMRIRAVVANGRYYDRPALDALLADVKTPKLTP